MFGSNFCIYYIYNLLLKDIPEITIPIENDMRFFDIDTIEDDQSLLT